jgi:hypothetical protein
MLHFIVENDLAHLERIMHQASNGTLPLAYWRARVESLKASTLPPGIRHRIDRLKRELLLLEGEEMARNRNAA